jgi:hypothetical protein
LNQRHFGKTSLERNAQYTIVEIVTRIAARLHLVQMHNRQRVFQVIQGLIQQYRHIDRFIITTEYNRRFLAKYQRVHGFPCSPRFSRTALFTDGTKVQINRGQQINYSGHKHCYCYSFLMTTAMDGMIVDAYGPRVGSDNDHGMQNNSQLGQQLLAAQVGQPLMYVSSTDKGLHASLYCSNV